jgi:hypothetical protein
MPEMPMGLINSASVVSSDNRMLPNHEPPAGLHSLSLARMNEVLFDVIGFTKPRLGGSSAIVAFIEQERLFHSTFCARSVQWLDRFDDTCYSFWIN